MKAETLKKSILQLAVEGKLVPQIESEGTARELLERIKEEKEQLIKDKKIKRDKNESVIYRKNGHYYERVGKKEPVCIDDEILFDIPDSWEWARMSNCLDVRDGTHNTPKYVEVGYPLITSKNLTSSGNLDFSTYKNISREDYEQISKRSKVEYDDIIFAMIGSIGNPVLFRGDQEFAIKNVALFKNIQELNSMKYIYYYLYYAQNIMKKNASGGVQSFVSLTTLRKFLIPLPPLSEQHRIVEKIEELLPYIEKYDLAEQELTKLNEEFPEKMKKSILQYAVEGKLVPQIESEGTARELLERIKEEKEQLIKDKKIKRDKNESVIYRKNGHYYERVGKKEPVCIDDEIPFDIPDSWEWCRFGEIVQFSMGKTPPRKEDQYWGQAIYPWVSISDMIDGKYIDSTKEFVNEVAKDEIFKNRISEKGTLLMSFKLTVGKVSILNVDAFHNEAIISVYPYYDENYWIRNYLFKTLPLLSMEGDTKSAIKGRTLNRTSLYALLIPLPPLSEQHRIVERIEEILPLIEVL